MFYNKIWFYSQLVFMLATAAELKDFVALTLY